MNIQKYLLLAAALMTGVMASTQNVFAYGEAGCGPGSIIFKENSFSSQASAQGLNAISSLTKMLAITSHSSNCTATWSKYDAVEQERLRFVAENFWSLQGDLAKGQGEALNALAELHGCTMQDEVMKISRQMIGTGFDAENIANESIKLTKYCTVGDHS